MKVRLSNGMIRIRLMKEEVGTLVSGHPVFLSLPLAPASLTVALGTTASDTPEAVGKGGIRINLPETWLRGWTDAEVVGFDFDVRQEESPIRVVVEKDFPCAHDGDKPADPVRMP